MGEHGECCREEWEAGVNFVCGELIIFRKALPKGTCRPSSKQNFFVFVLQLAEAAHQNYNVLDYWLCFIVIQRCRAGTQCARRETVDLTLISKRIAIGHTHKLHLPERLSMRKPCQDSFKALAVSLDESPILRPWEDVACAPQYKHLLWQQRLRQIQDLDIFAEEVPYVHS